MSGQYLPSWTLPNIWVELLFEGHDERYNDCEDWVCVPIFDGRTGEWEICSGSCVKPEMVLVRCGNCGSVCVLDGLAQEAGVETFISASQSPENQSVCCNLFTDFEEEIAIKNTFFSRGQKGARQTACMLGTEVLCINESFVEVPVPFREEKEEVMSSLVEVPYFVFEDRTLPRVVEQFSDFSEVLEELFFVGFSQDISGVLLSSTSNFPWTSSSHKHRRRVSSEVVKTVCLEREVVNRVGFSKCPRSQAKIKGCTMFLCHR